MKGMFRLALSSYVVVGTACAPAFALQDPSVAPARLVAVAPTSVERGTPSPSLGTPSHAPSASAAHLPHASSAAAETLAVTVRGPGQLRAPGTAGFRATVSNGAASQYYFWWFAARCARRIGCAPSSYTLIAEGVGRDSLTVPVGATTAESDLVVQVAELDGTGRTGSSPMFVLTGPQQSAAATRATTGKTTCDWFAGRFYPHTDPFTGHTWTRKFRRDYCGNQVRWDPEG